jgi:predicted nucleic acid-binding protein
VTKAFLDTGFIVALESSDDQHHADVISHWRELIRNRPRVVTTTSSWTRRSPNL